MLPPHQPCDFAHVSGSFHSHFLHLYSPFQGPFKKCKCPALLGYVPLPCPGRTEGISVLPLQLPSFINTTLPPHEQVTAQEIDSYFRHELIYKRNERMGKRVMALLQENEDKICFFAFGAGVGPSGGGMICRVCKGWEML